MDRVLRRTHLPERLRSAVQIHDAGLRSARYIALQICAKGTAAIVAQCLPTGQARGIIGICRTIRIPKPINLVFITSPGEAPWLAARLQLPVSSLLQGSLPRRTNGKWLSGPRAQRAWILSRRAFIQRISTSRLPK